MANSFLGLDTPNIASGWGPMPKLDAPSIGSLVASILGNRLARDKMTQESIADTIKNVQEQRQSSAYLDAMQKAGVLPEGDYGALGAKGASLLAQEILRKKVADARAAHLGALTAHVGSGRGRGGGGSSGGTSEPETRWDDQGREWRRGPSGRWIPMPRTPSEKAIQPTAKERGWAAPEIPGLSVNINAPEDTVPLAPDIPPMPDTGTTDDTAATSDAAPPPLLRRPPADQAAGHADGYGVKATYMKAPDGTVSPVDPNLVEYYKSKGAVVVAGP